MEIPWPFAILMRLLMWKEWYQCQKNRSLQKSIQLSFELWLRLLWACEVKRSGWCAQGQRRKEQSNLGWKWCERHPQFMRTPVSRLRTMERTTTTACNKTTAASATTARSGRRPGESIRYVANICIQTILPGNSRPWIIPCERCKNGEKKSSLYQYPRLFNGVA